MFTGPPGVFTVKTFLLRILNIRNTMKMRQLKIVTSR